MNVINHHTKRVLLTSRQSNLLKTCLSFRSASSNESNPLDAFKVEKKDLGQRNANDKSLGSAETGQLTVGSEKDNRGFIKKLFNFPVETPALRDELPAEFSQPDFAKRERSKAKFYNNLVIYDFPKLPPVKHAELMKIKQEYHAILPQDIDQETQWLPIFRMPAVTLVRAVIRFKLYLTGASSLVLVRELYRLLEHLTFDASPAFYLASISVAGLLLIGNFFRSMVVQIYTTEDLKYLRFCRFSFYGNRQDIIVPMEYVMPLTETNPTMRMPYYNLHFRKPEEVDLDHDYLEFYNLRLKIFVQFGGMRDRETFEAVLGKLLRNKAGA